MTYAVRVALPFQAKCAACGRRWTQVEEWTPDTALECQCGAFAELVEDGPTKEDLMSKKTTKTATTKKAAGTKEAAATKGAKKGYARAGRVKAAPKPRRPASPVTKMPPGYEPEQAAPATSEAPPQTPPAAPTTELPSGK